MTKDDLLFIWEKALAKGGRLFGYDIRPLVRHAPRSIDVFELVVCDLIAHQPDIFFLQIGAHNGRDNDPIAPLVREHHWRGLLVEPQKQVFTRLLENYAGEKQLLFENAAIAEREGTFTLYAFEGASAEDPASMAASSRRHYLTLNSEGRRGTITPIEVPALTLNGLLAKHGVERVDLLQIDTEGYDFQIIKMIDFNRIKPQIIHFESNYLNRSQKEECVRIFDAQGYSFLTLGIDSIAYQQPRDPSADERLAMSRINVA
jgi:FkbM family methyltransferase